MSTRGKLAFTCGDPAGVGPEIIAAWLSKQGAAAKDIAVIGPLGWLATLDTPAEKIAVGLEDFSATPGHPSAAGALVAWAAMERAAAGCLSGEFSGVVTGPVSKERLAAIGYEFPGQTEFFAARWGGEPVMAFILLSLNLKTLIQPRARGLYGGTSCNACKYYKLTAIIVC